MIPPSPRSTFVTESSLKTLRFQGPLPSPANQRSPPLPGYRPRRTRWLPLHSSFLLTVFSFSSILLIFFISCRNSGCFSGTWWFYFWVEPYSGPPYWPIFLSCGALHERVPRPLLDFITPVGNFLSIYAIWMGKIIALLRIQPEGSFPLFLGLPHSF